MCAMLKTPILRYCTVCFFTIPLRPVKGRKYDCDITRRNQYFQGIIGRLRVNTVSEIHSADSATETPIPTWLRLSGIMPGIGVIFGKNKLITISMIRSIKITVLWLLTVCGFAAHSICDVLPGIVGGQLHEGMGDVEQADKHCQHGIDYF